MYPRMIALIGLSLTAAGGSVAAPEHHPAPPPPATATFTKLSTAIPFDLFRGERIFLRGSLNGVSTSMMVDNGAPMTIIDKAFADRIGLKGGQTIAVRGATGEQPAQLANNLTLTVGSIRLTKASGLIMDMSPAARRIGRPVPVILGYDAFVSSAVTIDFPKRTIRFADKATFKPPEGAARLDLTKDGRVPRLRMAVAGLEPIDASLDLGNPGTVILANSYWKGQPSLASLRYAQSEIVAGGGAKPSRRVTLPTVGLGGQMITDVPATLNEDPETIPTEGGNVGIGMLKPFVVTTDFSRDALYLIKSGPIAPPSKERAGVSVELTRDRLKVTYVSPDGPAVAAGLKVGDEIVVVNGRRVDAHYYDLPDWTQGEAGRIVTLARADGSNVKLKLADYY